MQNSLNLIQILIRERLSFNDGWRIKLGDTSSADEDIYLYEKVFQPFFKSGQ